MAGAACWRVSFVEYLQLKAHIFGGPSGLKHATSMPKVFYLFSSGLFLVVLV